MEKRSKLRRFAEIDTFSKRVLQLDAGKPFQGKNGQKDFFKNDKPLVLENWPAARLEYTVNLGQLFPHKNFIGIDYKGNRIWRGAKTALEDGVANVMGFLRIQIEMLLDYFGDMVK